MPESNERSDYRLLVGDHSRFEDEDGNPSKRSAVLVTYRAHDKPVIKLTKKEAERLKDRVERVDQATERRVVIDKEKSTPTGDEKTNDDSLIPDIHAMSYQEVVNLIKAAGSKEEVMMILEKENEATRPRVSVQDAARGRIKEFS